MSSNLDQEIAAYKRMEGDLLANHKGKFVVIYGEELVDSFDNFETAASEAIKRYGRGPYLIRCVGEAPVCMPASVAFREIHASH